MTTRYYLGTSRSGKLSFKTEIGIVSTRISYEDLSLLIKQQININVKKTCAFLKTFKKPWI